MRAMTQTHPWDEHSLPTFDYALVNAAQTDPSYWADLAPVLVVPERYRAQPELFPVLVDVRALDHGMRSKIRERAIAWEQDGDTPYFMALLNAPVTASQLATHLTKRMVVRRPDGEEDVLRFYDPFVFRHLSWLLTAEQMDSLLGPVDCWHWSDGTWYVYSRSTPQPSLRPLRLTSGQWPTLMRMTDINRALAQIKRLDPDHPDGPDTARALDTLLDEAWQRYRFSDREDRVLYATQAVRIHRHIHRHPALQERLRLAETRQLSFVAACADLDDTVLYRMKQALEQNQRTER
jgi:hypothetical protein